MCVLGWYVHVNTGAQEGQKRAACPWVLESQAVVRHPIKLLETELESSTGAGKALNSLMFRPGSGPEATRLHLESDPSLQPQLPCFETDFSVLCLSFEVLSATESRFK